MAKEDECTSFKSMTWAAGENGLEMGQGKNRETSKSDSRSERPRGWAMKREA